MHTIRQASARFRKTRLKTSAPKSLLAFPALLLCCLMLSSCGRTEPIQQSGFHFDTIITITLYDPSRTEELEHCFELARLYESYFSTKIEDSDISRINAAAGTPVKVHEETAQLLQKGLYYSKLSNGAFDITIGKLANLWDFHAQTPKIPDAAALTEAAAGVDYRNVIINGNEVTLKNKNAAIDTGGIAKGYIADKMKEYLVSEGVTSGLINLGGNVLAIGSKTGGKAYTIGIQKPFEQTGTAIACVQLKDQTVVTSGIYERSFEQNGVLCHHLLDTKTGYPLDNGLLSVSIICPDSADGDGLSTACFSLGLDAGMALIESLEQTEAIFITSDYKLHTSSGMGKEIPFQVL